LETNNTFNPVLHIIVDVKLSGRGMDKRSLAVTDIQVRLKPYHSTVLERSSLYGLNVSPNLGHSG
jgi:hypothetical protein